jgi:hypothetical protein
MYGLSLIKKKNLLSRNYLFGLKKNTEKKMQTQKVTQLVFCRVHMTQAQKSLDCRSEPGFKVHVSQESGVWACGSGAR